LNATGSGTAVDTAEVFTYVPGSGGAGSTFALLVSTMQVARSGHTASLIGSKVYVIGGGSLIMEVWDTVAATFAASGTASNATLRTLHTANVTPTGFLFVSGGSGDTTSEIYDPVRASFIPGPTMQVSRSQAGAVMIDDTVSIFGGSGDAVTPSSEEDVILP
jgi:hypothetical protein